MGPFASCQAALLSLQQRMPMNSQELMQNTSLLSPSILFMPIFRISENAVGRSRKGLLHVLDLPICLSSGRSSILAPSKRFYSTQIY